MHPLNDVPARIKHSSDVLSVNSSGEVGVTEVPPVMSLHADFLERERKREKLYLSAPEPIRKLQLTR